MTPTEIEKASSRTSFHMIGFTESTVTVTLLLTLLLILWFVPLSHERAVVCAWTIGVLMGWKFRHMMQEYRWIKENRGSDTR